jgi:hypothetical protein
MKKKYQDTQERAHMGSSRRGRKRLFENSCKLPRLLIQNWVDGDICYCNQGFFLLFSFIFLLDIA